MIANNIARFHIPFIIAHCIPFHIKTGPTVQWGDSVPLGLRWREGVLGEMCRSMSCRTQRRKRGSHSQWYCVSFNELHRCAFRSIWYPSQSLFCWFLVMWEMKTRNQNGVIDGWNDCDTRSVFGILISDKMEKMIPSCVRYPWLCRHPTLLPFSN